MAAPHAPPAYRFSQFQQAAKPTDSWAAMQQLCLDLDRLTLLKEREGRYYRGTHRLHACEAAVPCITVCVACEAPSGGCLSTHAAFDSTNEVLSSAVETVTLINSHTAPVSWEITKCDLTIGSDRLC